MTKVRQRERETGEGDEGEAEGKGNRRGGGAKGGGIFNARPSIRYMRPHRLWLNMDILLMGKRPAVLTR